MYSWVYTKRTYVLMGVCKTYICTHRRIQNVHMYSWVYTKRTYVLMGIYTNVHMYSWAYTQTNVLHLLLRRCSQYVMLGILIYTYMCICNSHTTETVNLYYNFIMREKKMAELLLQILKRKDETRPLHTSISYFLNKMVCRLYLVLTVCTYTI